MRHHRTDDRRKHRGLHIRPPQSQPPLSRTPNLCFPPQPSDPETFPKLAEATSGLQYLHSMGIIHNDLKPVRVTNYFY